jgi:hypothetical protein
MKKLYVLFLISLMPYSVTNGQFTKAGGGFGYSSGFQFHDMPWDANKSGHFDLALKGIYQLKPSVQISPSFTYLFSHITKESSVGEEITTNVSTMMFDINGQYIFNTPDRFEFYGLAGLDILLANKKEVYSSPESTNRETDNALGLNVGVGSFIKITEQVSLYGELKYVVSKYDQFMLNLGVLFNLDWLKKNETPAK